MIERGVPGAYVRSIRARHLRNTLLASLIALCAAGVALALLSQTRLTSALVATGFAVCGGVLARTEWIAVRRAQSGLRAEELAATSLRSSGVAVLVFGATLGRGDCDAIAIGPQLVAVEVKHGRGEVQGTAGALSVGGRALRKDPLRQANAQAAAIRRRCGVYTDAVVCITGMTNQPFAANGVWVCSSQDLPSVIRRLPGRVTRFQAATIAGGLAAGEPAENP
jgi:Holliday junction resolvase-like predicted endonuclease